MAGATGALGALAAGSLVKPAPAHAAQGSAVIEGADNTGATSRTAVFTVGNQEWGYLADPSTSGKGSLGIYGQRPELRRPRRHRHRHRHRRQWRDHRDQRSRRCRLGHRRNFGLRCCRIRQRERREGDLARLFRGGVVGQGQSGVVGDGIDVGVLGFTDSGNGTSVSGLASGAGIGVSGVAASGSGVYAQASSGDALRCSGRASFLGPTIHSRSGVATITYPAKSVTVTVPGGLTSKAMALAILQNAIAGVYVASAAPKPRPEGSPST